MKVGQPASGEHPAYLSADPRINAGLPVVVALRKIDEIEVDPLHSRAALAPGDHHLIIDCTVAQTQSTTRFLIDLDAESGAHYRLVADLEPGNRACKDVRIESH